MKKKLFIGLLIIVGVLLTYGIYKMYILNKYQISNEKEFNEVVDNIKDLSITTDKTLSNTKCFDMNFYLPENLTESTNNIDDMKAYNDDSNSGTIVNLFISKGSKWIDSVEKNDWITNEYEIEELMKKYNISHEIELIKYYKTRIEKDNNIFTSKSQILIDYSAFDYIYGTYFSRGYTDNPQVLTGDLMGTISQDSDEGSDDGYIAHIYNQDDVYTLMIKSFSYDEVLNILRSISFE